MNPFNQYQVIKNSLVCRTECPHCRHRFQVMRRDCQHELSCLNCGRKFKISRNGTPIRQIKSGK